MTHIFGQGVQYRGKILYLLHILLLFAASYLPLTVSAEPDKQVITLGLLQNRIVIIHPADNMTHSKLAQKISSVLTDRKVARLLPTTSYTSPDIVIALGKEVLNNANKIYPETNKLFIVTDPGVYRAGIYSDKNNAVLYMTQSYCKQIEFIKLINENWKVVGLLNSQQKPVDSSVLEQCAMKYDMKTYMVNTEDAEHLTSDITEALNHSDILLALPDSHIYNSKTVKNILLTSYRFRKPVIGFSHNFVNAGALASIHSSLDQIAETAGNLVISYLDAGNRITSPVSYPQLFDISINKQVFMALDLTIPDTNELKQALKQLKADDTGMLQ